MYHDHGIVVRLEARGYEIEEFGYPRNQDPADPDWNDTRAIISAKPKIHFSVVLELTEKVRPFTATALKLTIAIGHHLQAPGDIDDVQAWHVPLNQISKNRFMMSQQLCWGGQSCEPLVDNIMMPAPEGRSNDPWMMLPLADFRISLRI